jgi:WD40 repeat protein/energy-coupling factor transporter ATP-binding protein EcfA2
MAEVYKAYQPGLDRYVAVKVLHKHLAEEAGFVGRFEREAASIARLRHPNIVQVIDFDRHDDQYFMVMEFIDGPTLRGQGEEREKPFSAEEAAYVISGVAGGLDYAHGRGVVHRDVKPGNIMFTGEGQVVLTDFGIAHIVGTTLYTESGGMLGTPAYMAPEQGRGEMGNARGDIYSLGVVLYEMLTGRLPYEADTPLGMIQQHVEGQLPPPRMLNANIPEDVEAVVLKAMAVDPGDRYQHAGEMSGALMEALGLRTEGVGIYPVAREVAVEEEEEVARPLPSCPYRGLFAFREEDAPYFYGREAFTDRLVAVVEENPLVGVLGPSGSGKSSVVFAGLLPHLRQAAGLRGEEGRAWAIAVCRPGHSPFYSLATVLVPQLEGEVSDTARLVGTQELAIGLREGEVTLSEVCEQILEEGEAYGRFLLVIDQFEELFTLCQDDDERRNFIDTLLAVCDADSPLRLILTLRADFLGQAVSHRGFADGIQNALLILGPMTRGELSQAVENPARKQGVGFEAGLVERVLDDVGDEPGNLPLLEFALTQLWGEQKTGSLSHEAYEAIGGVEGALARYADQVYGRLSEEERDSTRRAFTQMVMPGEGTQDTRRMAQRDELGEGDWELVRKLADARLVVTDLDVVSEIETVEVVHEALIQSWGQLRGWMMEDRAFRTWQERLRASLRGWEASERDEGALLRGGPLVEAEDWLEARRDSLGEGELEYIGFSLNARQARQAAEAERQARELALERRSRRFLRILAGVMGVAAVIALILSIFAFYQRQAAQTQAGILLASQAESELEKGFTDRSLLLALEALEHYPYSPQAEHALGRAVSYNRALGLYDGHESAVTSVAWSPDGKRVASSSTDNTVQVWDASTGEEQLVIELPEGITGNVWNFALSVVWSPDGEQLLTLSGDRYLLGSQDYHMMVWDAESGEQVMTLKIPNQAKPEEGEGVTTSANHYITSAAYGPESGRLATVGGDDTAIIWDASIQEPEFILSGHENDVNVVAWSPDEVHLVTASEDGTARIWDADTDEETMVLAGHEGALNAVIWSPDGNQLATAGDDGFINIWDVETGEVMYTFEPNAGIVWSLAWSPDGAHLITGTQDSIIRIWEIETGEVIAELNGHDNFVTQLAWSPGGERLASTGADGVVRLWNAAPSTAVQSLPYAWVADSDWSSDGRHIAIAAGDPWFGLQAPMLPIWDVNAGQPLIDDLTPDFNYNWMEAKYSPDDRMLLVRGLSSWPDGISDIETLYALDAQTGDTLASFTIDSVGWMRDGDWSPDGTLVAGGTVSGTIAVWDFATGDLLQTMVHEDEPFVNELEWSPDGNRIASAIDYATAWIWDAITGEALFPLTGHELPASIWSVTWSPDGSRLLTTSGNSDVGAKDTTARIWDAETGEELLVIDEHTSDVTWGGWSPNGNRIVTFSSDNTARIWDATTGDKLLTLDIPTIYGGFAEWSPDGEYLLTLGFDTEIWRVWQTTEELIDYAKECCLFRELTMEERALFGLPER